MPSNIAYDPKLLDEAMKLGHHKTKKETVNTALKQYVHRHLQLEVLNLFGKIDYDADYDYKKARKKR